MNTVWILVCDAAKGRLFETRENAPQFHLVHTFDHPSSREKTSEIVSDHAGTRSAEGASVHHNALAPHSDPKEVEKDHFAHAICQHLDKSLRDQKFDKLVLVAPPHFLGSLKGELGTQLQNKLMTTVDKDYAQLDARALEERLHDVVRIPASDVEGPRVHGKSPHR